MPIKLLQVERQNPCPCAEAMAELPKLSPKISKAGTYET